MYGLKKILTNVDALDIIPYHSHTHPFHSYKVLMRSQLKFKIIKLKSTENAFLLKKGQSIIY